MTIHTRTNEKSLKAFHNAASIRKKGENSYLINSAKQSLFENKSLDQSYDASKNVLLKYSQTGSIFQQNVREKYR